VDDDLRVADLLTALSVATDLGMGRPPETAIRSCLVAVGLARAAGCAEREVRDVYYTSLLQHLGCSGPAHELAAAVGDERRFLGRVVRVDEVTPRGVLTVFAAAGQGTGARRPVHVARLVAMGPSGGAAVVRATCEVGSRLARRLHLGDPVATAIHEGAERWDGRGLFGHGGETVPLPTRVSALASQAVLAHLDGGTEAAAEVVRARAGGWFDPQLAATFARQGPDLLRELDAVDVWPAALAAEPAPPRRVPPGEVATIATVFADLADLKTPDTLGHSRQVAELAVGAGARVGLGSEDVGNLRLAGLLHDLGRVAVANDVWERPGTLTTTQREQVRLHPYHTERILDRAAALRPVARVAGMHHERLDGSGYHHGARGASLPMAARLLAAADAFQAMTQPRPHRPARSPAEAAEVVGAEAAAGRLDPDGVRAVVATAGQVAPRTAAGWPAGLTDREVEVLRHLARGASNRRIAEQLVISRRTAEHHVQHIYAKIGASTRAAAALFAVEHGLVR
jgi:response regulator RpfG family c-di-GMP phosphodiesterase/DNA-binding CsgD family transcriptional regulator